MTDWYDDFERADGAIGVDWEIAENVGNGDSEPTGAPFTISGGAAVASYGTTTPTSTLRRTQMRWLGEQDADQSVEIEVELVAGNNASLTLFTNSNDSDAACNALEVNFLDASSLPDYVPSEDDRLRLELSRYSAGGTQTVFDLIDINGYPPEPIRLRLESDVDGTLRAYVNDEEVLSVVDPAPPTGPYVGMGVWIFAFLGSPYVSPRILAAGTTVEPAVELHASWVAGYRTGEATGEVASSDVNTGLLDVQSSQAAVVMETFDPADALLAESDADLIIGGGTTAYTGPIYSAGAWTGTDPNGGVPIWTFDPNAPLDT